MPAVTGAAGTDSASWVGVDGAPSSNHFLIQTGTMQKPGVGYWAWWDLLPGVPSPSTPITAPGGALEPVAPGDSMFASVEEVQPGTWTVYLVDKTQGWYFRRNFAYSGPGTSAEWIEEAPLVNGQQSVPADFGTVGFSGTGVYGDFGNGTGWWTTEMTASNEEDIVNAAGTRILAAPGAPSAPAAGGQSFTDTYILPPSAPVGLDGNQNGSSVDLTWDPSATTGGLPIQAYIVGELSGGSYVPITKVSGTSATLTGAVAGVPYTLAVAAVNAGGWPSPYSSPITVIPSATTTTTAPLSTTTTTAVPLSTPGAPGAPQAVASGPGQVTVSWVPPTATGGYPITGYFVTAHRVGGQEKTVYARTPRLRLFGLPTGTYYFTVNALGPGGMGAPSGSSAFVKIVDAQPKVFVTPPGPRFDPGEVTIRVTTNIPGARVQIFDQPFAARRFFSKAVATAGPSASGNGVVELNVHVVKTNRFYATVDNVRSNVVTAVVY